MDLFKKVIFILTGLLIHTAYFAQERDPRIAEQQLLREYARQHLPQAAKPVRQVAPVKHVRKVVYQQQAVSYRRPPPQARAPLQVPDAEQLFAAALNGNVPQVKNLLSQGIDINTANQERETALHMAASRGHYSTVIFLINNGAYIHARTIKNWFPLHHAVRFRHANIANFLVQRGASPHARTSDGLSAIDMATNVNDLRLLSILGSR